LNWREAALKIADMLVNDSQVSVRQQAAISLAYLMSQETGPALVKALNDSSISVRNAAAHTIGIIRYKAAEDALIKMLPAEEESFYRTAIAALGKLQSKKALPLLKEALKHKNKYINIEAVRAIGEIGDTAIDYLLPYIKSQNEPSLRAEAALALAKLGSKEGLSAARELISSPDFVVKNNALNAIVAASDIDSLPTIEKMLTEETDERVKSILDFAAQNLRDIKAKETKPEEK